jgi:N-acyl-D-aspartate/D-glutamate deacylase
MKAWWRLSLLVLLFTIPTAIDPTLRRGLATAVPYDVVIRNARIADGSGNPWFRADVAVKDGRIARIGRIPSTEALNSIDARGQILAPGFIDVHTHVENIYNLPAAENFIHMGVNSVPHPRGYGNNTRVLGHYVRELKLLSLEDAIRKMTSLPAQTFGFLDRGLIREGFAADLIIFDENTISDRATYADPRQFPTGISNVMVTELSF